jgi:hypothetical protein
MTETTSDIPVAATSNGLAASSSAARSLDSTDQPIPLWPEGVIAAVAGVALLVIGLRHRTWIQRKVTEGQRAVEEFQRHGGLEDLTQVAKQASELLKGAGK